MYFIKEKKYFDKIMAFLTIAFFGVWLIWEGNWRGKGEDVGKVGTGIAGGGIICVLQTQFSGFIKRIAQLVFTSSIGC